MVLADKVLNARGNSSGSSIVQGRKVLLIRKQNPIRANAATKIRYYYQSTGITTFCWANCTGQVSVFRSQVFHGRVSAS